MPSEQYPVGSFVAALYPCGGICGMERGTLSEERNPNGSEHLIIIDKIR